MFDSFWVSPKFNLECHHCKCWLLGEFQTKDLESTLSDYFLAPDRKIYLIEPPCDDKFWVEYTKEEIEEEKKQSSIFFFKQMHGGYYKDEAFQFENREWKQVINFDVKSIYIYASCHSKECQHLGVLQNWNEFRLDIDKNGKVRKITRYLT